MDIDCALLPTTTINEEQIHHILHGHPLILGKNKQLLDDEEEVNNCCVCGKGCSAVFHPYHPLTQLKRSDISESYSYFDKLFMNNESFCNACRKLILPFTCGQQNRQSIAYICEDYKCDFLLHDECSTLMLPAITYEGHGHLLQSRDHNIEKNELNCSVCQYNICESYFFTCIYCDLNLHLTCGPLPYTIKIKCHLQYL
ncbi:hypothetical protein CMV_023822 [Castanea mollissima]|uniref:DC1 domain-containing protein n=1 Tax=Castanea mollissima TaxID=60419 RepID=A0A8J4QNT7_9ROSI|nr:hypothetical protein CMV_023822 [Castanea mollissima]